MIENFSYFSIPRRFDIIIEVKDRDDNESSLLTLDAFAEMVDIHERIYNDVWYIREEFVTDDGEVLMAGGDPAYYADTCKKHYPTESDQENSKPNTVDKNVSACLNLYQYGFESSFLFPVRHDNKAH